MKKEEKSTNDGYYRKEEYWQQLIKGYWNKKEKNPQPMGSYSKEEKCV